MSDALLDAIKTHDLDRLAQLLAAGADPNTRFTSYQGFPSDITALHIAVAESRPKSENEPGGSIDAVVLLLRYGALVNCRNTTTETTPLLTAVYRNVAAVPILLAAGADPNVCDDEGDSPLRVCADKGYLEMARLLLLCGATKTIDEWGGAGAMTALGLAARELHVEMVKLLLAHGADPQGRDVDGLTALDVLQYASMSAPDAEVRLQEIRRLLGADPSTVPIKRPTAQDTEQHS